MKVYLDPGHGGKDPGTSGNGLVEKDVALDIALETRRILQDDYTGVEVRMSRTTDVFISLEDRAADARDWGADLFVSIHCNGGTANGFETFKHSNSTASAGPQRTLHEAILAAMPGWVRDRGMKSANFSVLRNTYQHMYAVLTENLFLGHDDSAEWLKQRSARVAVARGHADAIADILGAEKEDDMPSVSEIWAHEITNLKKDPPAPVSAASLLQWAHEHATDAEYHSADAKTSAAKAVIELQAVKTELAEMHEKLDQVAAGNVDYATLARAVADELAERLAEQEGTPS